ncbi:MAG: alcohol dehydrogenase catalytic domain-containing protein [Planctomycetota bacterium]|jgi:L-iditol 2-dehydrogenase
MRVAMYYSNSDIRIEEMPKPGIGPGEILVKVHASGVCGSDVMEWYRKDKVPLVLGHEIGGEVVETGEGVESCKVGDRIAASHHVPCNDCPRCHSGHETTCDTLRSTNFDPGGFCEYFRLPALQTERGVYVLPDEITYEDATFIEPLACAYRGQRLSGMAQGKNVLVLGSGISGMLHINLAKALGAALVVATDVSDYRRRTALKLGADAAFDAKVDIAGEFRDLNNGYGADIVILCAGAPSAIEQALDSIERGGTVLFFAAATEGAKLPKSVNEIFWKNEVTLTSSYAGNRHDHETALEHIRRGRVSVRDMVTHRFPIADSVEAFRLVAEADESLKVIINPNE